MNEKQTLENISQSLKPNVTGEPSQPTPIVAFDFSEISRQLKQLLDENKRKNDMLETFSRIDLDITALSDQSSRNLKKIGEISRQLDARLKALDSQEAKWNLIIQRVNSVLDELERVLRQM